MDTRTHAHMHKQTNACTHARTHAHTYTQTHTHTHTHTNSKKNQTIIRKKGRKLSCAVPRTAVSEMAVLVPNIFRHISYSCLVFKASSRPWTKPDSHKKQNMSRKCRNTHTHTHTLKHTHTHTHTHTHIHTLSLSHTHTHARTHACPHTPTHTHTAAPSPRLKPHLSERNLNTETPTIDP